MNKLLEEEFWNTASVEDVKKALDEGADVNARDKLGRTPLHLALDNNATQAMLVRLLDSGADINARDNSGNSSLHYAFYEQEATFALLIERGADVNVCDVAGNTLLHHASHGNSYAENTSMLIEAGADVNARDWYECTPLHIAVEYQDVSLQQDKMIEVLLKGGADINVRNKDGKTPLELFKDSKNENELKTSKAYWQLRSAEINKRDKSGKRTFNYLRKLLALIR